MKSQLVSFQSADGLNLSGLLYEPKKRSKKVAIFLHGNGNASVFNNPGLQNLIGETLAKKGIAYFPFDNRGAHYIKSLKKKVGGKLKRFTLGSGFELIRDCVKDIDGAVAFLKRQGFKEFYLMGASTGAVKIPVYNFYKPKNIFSGFIFLGASDDTGIYYTEWGPKKFFSILKMAKTKIEKGEGEELVPKHFAGTNIISWKSLFDTINPDGDYNIFPFNEYWNDLHLAKKKKLFRELQSIKTSSLFIYGAKDEFCYGKVPQIVETLKEKILHKKIFDFRIIQNSDHGYHGKEKELAKLLADWLGTH
ncbi:MAG: alpha/beta hydrolase [Candidatus Pacebacteria bacterium]|nr:alpha/beta hydrolase [Candidatus Paceibacterota bacterium]